MKREDEWISAPRFHFGISGICTYCGGEASQIDHVIPVSYMENGSRRRSKREVGKKSGFTTNACPSCNSRLGDKVFWTMAERLAYVEGKYAKMAEGFKKAPSWSDEEIAELDHCLRTYVASRQMAMRRLDKQRSWRWSPDYVRVMRTALSQVELDQSSFAYVPFLGEFFEGVM